MYVMDTSNGNVVSSYTYNEVGSVIAGSGNYFDEDSLSVRFLTIINNSTNEHVYRKFNFSTMAPEHESTNRITAEFIGHQGYYVEDDSSLWIIYTNTLNQSGSDFTLYARKFDRNLNPLYATASFNPLGSGNTMRGSTMFYSSAPKRFMYQYQGNGGSRSDFWTFELIEPQRKFPIYEKGKTDSEIEILTYIT